MGQPKNHLLKRRQFFPTGGYCPNLRGSLVGRGQAKIGEKVGYNLKAKEGQNLGSWIRKKVRD